MYVLVIEFDRTRPAETRREKRLWTFSERGEAERETERFADLVRAGSTQYLKGGDKLSFQESRLYFVETNDKETAELRASNGDAQLIHHAFNPALDNPTYWEEFLAQLEAETAKTSSA
jgi:hypothetical protein